MFVFTEDSQPEKVFVRHARLAFSEITSYKCDSTLRWHAITGLTPEVYIHTDSIITRSYIT